VVECVECVNWLGRRRAQWAPLAPLAEAPTASSLTARPRADPGKPVLDLPGRGFKIPKFGSACRPCARVRLRACMCVSPTQTYSWPRRRYVSTPHTRAQRAAGERFVPSPALPEPEHLHLQVQPTFTYHTGILLYIPLGTVLAVPIIPQLILFPFLVALFLLPGSRLLPEATFLYLLLPTSNCFPRTCWCLLLLRPLLSPRYLPAAVAAAVPLLLVCCGVHNAIPLLFPRFCGCCDRCTRHPFRAHPLPPGALRRQQSNISNGSL